AKSERAPADHRDIASHDSTTARLVRHGEPPSPVHPPLAEADGFEWVDAVRELRHGAGAPAVTALVHTRDAARRLADCLRSLAWADEVVVVDMESADDTVRIAGEHGARVVSHPHTGYVE